MWLWLQPPFFLGCQQPPSAWVYCAVMKANTQVSLRETLTGTVYISMISQKHLLSLKVLHIAWCKYLLGGIYQIGEVAYNIMFQYPFPFLCKVRENQTFSGLSPSAGQATGFDRLKGGYRFEILWFIHTVYPTQFTVHTWIWLVYTSVRREKSGKSGSSNEY